MKKLLMYFCVLAEISAIATPQPSAIIQRLLGLSIEGILTCAHVEQLSQAEKAEISSYYASHVHQYKLACIGAEERKQGVHKNPNLAKQVCQEKAQALYSCLGS
jgi:hypothetical protein